MTGNIYNLVQIVDKLKTKEAGFEKWNELPPEIKLECIKTLDFKTGWSLRSTSRTERALVDSQKLKFDYIHINESSLFMETPPNCSVPFKIYFADITYIENIVPFLNHILNHSVINHLKVGYGSLQDRTIEMLKKTFLKTKRLFSVKYLDLDLCNEDYPFWIKTVNEKVIERIDIKALLYFNELHKIPQINNVHLLQITELVVLDCAHKLAQIWMNNDAEIGREFQADVTKPMSLEIFCQNFPDRIISKKSQYVRIRTDNPAKHILLERSESDSQFMGRNEEFYRMSVISADRKESEIDEDWVLAILDDLSSEDDSDSEPEGEDGDMAW